MVRTLVGTMLERDADEIARAARRRARAARPGTTAPPWGLYLVDGRRATDRAWHGKNAAATIDACASGRPFDLDGTLVDSGRDHPRLDPARDARPCSARDPGRGADRHRRRAGPRARRCARFDPDRVDELVARLPRAQRAAARRARGVRRDRSTCSTRCGRGRRLGIVTAKRRATVELAFDARPGLGALFDVVVGGDDTERHKPRPGAAPARARARSAPRRRTPRTSATRRSTSAPRRRRACFAVAVTLGRHPPARARSSGGAGRDRRAPRRSCLTSSERPTARAAELRELLEH